MKYSLYLALMGMMIIGCDATDEPNVNPAENLETTVQYKSVASVDANLNSVDIYYTSNTELGPVIIWVHGGAWAIGDKSNKMDDKINLFREQEGYILVSVNYRLSPFPVQLNDPDRIMFPTHNHDVADAIRWVHDNIADYGGDAARMALMGHSAGAHLVSLTGTNNSFLDDVGLSLSSIKGVAAIDTEGYDIADELSPANREQFHINAFGLDDTIYPSASPIANISGTKNHPDFFIAKRGAATRLAKANAFISVLEQNGVSVSVVDGSVYDHEGINDAIGDDNDTTITPQLIAFFREVFN